MKRQQNEGDKDEKSEKSKKKKAHPRYLHSAAAPPLILKNKVLTREQHTRASHSARPCLKCIREKRVDETTARPCLKCIREKRVDETTVHPRQEGSAPALRIFQKMETLALGFKWRLGYTLGDFWRILKRRTTEEHNGTTRARELRTKTKEAASGDG